MKFCYTWEAVEDYLNGHDLQATQQKRRKSKVLGQSSAKKQDESINTFRSRKCTMQ